LQNLRHQVTKSEQHPFQYGGFADIYRGEWDDPASDEVKKVAIKVLRAVHTNKDEIRETILRRLHREAHLWHPLSHENVLPFFGVCNDDEVWLAPALISPLCENGNVMQYLAKHPGADKLKMILEVASGLQYLHSKNIVHGDLKPHNVIIDDTGTARLCDFGRSKVIGHRGYTTIFTGTGIYMAPELLAFEPPPMQDANESDAQDDSLVTSEEPFAPNLSKETDIYGFGMVSLEITTRKSPYYYLPSNHMFHTRIIQGTRPLRTRYLSSALTDVLWQLLEDCWAQDPLFRPGVERVVERLTKMQR